jgi:hypothetical protein
MTSYESVIGTLEAELTAVADAFGGLTPDQWQRSTLLVPVDPICPSGRCSSWPGISTSPSG